MKITAHTLVKNEERYIWYSLMSVVDHVDKIMVWDTGSTDNTVNIIENVRKKYPGKIKFEKFGAVTPEEYTVLRQKMLDKTESDWFMILDGDEVWWDSSIRTITEFIKLKGNTFDSIVNPYFNIVGDIYHFQEESAGMYKIDDKKGHLTIRFMNRKIPGLYTSRPLGQHGYFDNNNKLIQDRSSKKRIFLDAPYMHFTHMVRSSNLIFDKKVPKRDAKYKHELGKRFNSDFYFPEIFFLPKPSSVISPWTNLEFTYIVRSGLIKPLKKIKSKLFKEKEGY